MRLSFLSSISFLSFSIFNSLNTFQSQTIILSTWTSSETRNTRKNVNFISFSTFLIQHILGGQSQPRPPTERRHVIEATSLTFRRLKTSSEIVWCLTTSVTRLDNFLKIIGNKFSQKSGPNVCRPLGFFENITFKKKLLFGQHLEGLGYCFIPTSGHTDMLQFIWFGVLLDACW